MLGTETISGFDSVIERSNEKYWRPLRLFNYYRLVLACVLFALFLLTPHPTVMGLANPLMYYLASMGLLVSGVIYAYTIHAKIPGFQLQLNVFVVLDTVLLTMVVHASGGLSTGLGVLLIINVAFSSLIAQGRTAIVYAAFVTIAILIETSLSHLKGSQAESTYTHAGLLGITFFVTAYISLILSHRLRESQALVLQRELDLANLVELNDYIIQHLHSGILVVDAKQRLHLINGAAWSMLDSPPANRNQSLKQLSPALADRLSQWRNAPNEQAEAFKPNQGSNELIARFTRLGSSEDTGTLIFLEDATHLANQNQQTKLAALGRLTASIAHEIRNPLGAISHAAQLLEESPDLSQDDSRLAQIIHNHSNRMNDIIENILQLSRREYSHPAHMNLKHWLQQFVSEFCEAMHIDQEQFSIEISDESIEVYIDATHLHQIMWNLCQNAFSHGDPNDPARIHIVLSGGFNADSKQTFLEIRDNGNGIPEENVERIFEPFFTSAQNGTGLGLYITSELCQVNNARIIYTGKQTDGCSFRINFHNPEKIEL